MKLRAIALVLALAAWAAPQAQAELLTGGRVDDAPAPGNLVWDTFINASVGLFVKQGATFLNPTAGALSIDLTTPGIYDFDLRLNKGTGREMTGYTFDLFFEGAPDNSIPGVSVVGTRDTTGSTPLFAGDTTHIGTNNLIALTALRISSFNAVDEVGEFTAGADGHIDYVGNFQLTVSSLQVPVPEPSTLFLLVTALLGLGLTGRRNNE